MPSIPNDKPSTGPDRQPGGDGSLTVLERFKRSDNERHYVTRLQFDSMLQFDKFRFTVLSGGIVVSFSALGYFGEHAFTGCVIVWLYIAWGLFAIGLSALLASFHFTDAAVGIASKLRPRQAQLPWYTDKDKRAARVAEISKQDANYKRKNRKAKTCNVAASFGLFLGIIALAFHIFFSTQNKVEAMNKDTSQNTAHFQSDETNDTGEDGTQETPIAEGFTGDLSDDSDAEPEVPPEREGEDE